MEGGLKIEINKTENAKKAIEVKDSDFVDEKKASEEEDGSINFKEALGQVKKLEDLNTQIENSNDAEDRNNLFKQIEDEELEKNLDLFEEKLKGLGVDDGMVMAMYKDLNEEDVAIAVEEKGAEEFISDLVHGKFAEAQRRAAEKGFSPAQVAILIACFLFLMFGAPNKSSSTEILKSKTESSQEIEKNDIDKFLKKLDIVEIFHNQEYLDMKIPAKPNGHEDENWEIQIYEEGTTIGNIKVEEETFHGAFGRNRNVKIDKVELVIEKDGEFTRYEIDISGEKDFPIRKRISRGKTQMNYDEIIRRFDVESNYSKKFNLILKELESDENSEDVKKRIEDYFIQQATGYVDSLVNNASDDEMELVIDNFDNDTGNFISSKRVSEKVKDSIFDLSSSIELAFYEKEMRGLSGDEKLKKFSKDPLRYQTAFWGDSELLQLIENRIEKAKHLVVAKDDSEFKEVFEELSGIFESYQPDEHSPYYQCLNDYQDIKKDLRREEKRKATEDYLKKALEASEK